MKILEIRRGGVTQRIATCRTPDEVDQLQVNALFREFLHGTIALAAPLDPDRQSAAQTHRAGQFVDAPTRGTKSTALTTAPPR